MTANRVRRSSRSGATTAGAGCERSVDPQTIAWTQPSVSGVTPARRTGCDRRYRSSHRNSSDAGSNIGTAAVLGRRKRGGQPSHRNGPSNSATPPIAASATGGGPTACYRTRRHLPSPRGGGSNSAHPRPPPSAARAPHVASPVPTPALAAATDADGAGVHGHRRRALHAAAGGAPAGAGAGDGAGRSSSTRGASWPPRRCRSGCTGSG